MFIYIYKPSQLAAVLYWQLEIDDDDEDDEDDEDEEMFQHGKLGPYPTSTILCKLCNTFWRPWPSVLSFVPAYARHWDHFNGSIFSMCMSHPSGRIAMIQRSSGNFGALGTTCNPPKKQLWLVTWDLYIDLLIWPRSHISQEIIRNPHVLAGPPSNWPGASTGRFLPLCVSNFSCSSRSWEQHLSWSFAMQNNRR